jgi:hypothetical protein
VLKLPSELGYSFWGMLGSLPMGLILTLKLTYKNKKKERRKLLGHTGQFHIAKEGEWIIVYKCLKLP